MNRGRWCLLLLGVALLFVGMIFWVVFIVSIATEPEFRGDTSSVVGVAIVITIPIGIGIYCIIRVQRPGLGTTARWLGAFMSLFLSIGFIIAGITLICATEWALATRLLIGLPCIGMGFLFSWVYQYLEEKRVS